MDFYYCLKKGNTMNERIEVYETLRNELIVMEELQRNVWIHMYILFCTLFVLGLQWSYYLFLVSYIVLIPFQYVINDYKWSICKLSTYIRIFFEEEDPNINWESLHMFELYKEFEKQRRKSVRDIIGKSGAIHLGILTTGFYCGFALNSAYSKGRFVLGFESIILIILSIILLMILIFINKEYYKKYDSDLEDIIKRYKKMYIDNLRNGKGKNGIKN